LFKSTISRLRIIGLTAGLGLAATQAQAFTITATFDPTITGASNAADIEGAINQVTGVYDSLFTNPETVNIYFELGTSNGDLGESRSSRYRYTYADYVDLLTADSTANPANNVLATAVANLPFGNTPATTGRPYVVTTSAQGRAIGDAADPGVLGSDAVAGDGNYDGIVYLDAVPGELSWGSTTGPDQYSGISTIFHEVDEVLGVGGPGSTIGGPLVLSMGDEDLYRYDWITGHPSFTADPSVYSYFSIDGGAHYWQFFNQDPGGDRADWAVFSCGEHFIQNAFGCLGKNALTLRRNSVESIAFQAVGYNLSAAAPEPRGWAIAIAGLALLGAAARRRRLATA
jgi:hypothetical protein